MCPEPISADAVFDAIDAGHFALLVTGNVRDFCVVGDEIGYRPQRLVDQLHERGYTVIRYSKSQGPRIHNQSALTPDERKAVDERLGAVGLLPLSRETQGGPDEIRHFFRSMARLLQVPVGTSRPFAVVVEYTEHLAPAVHTSAAAADEHTFVSETLHALANAPALGKSRNLLICVVRHGFHNTLLDEMHRVDVPLPSEVEIETFARLALARTDRYGPLGHGLSARDLARLTRGLRMRDLDAILREARAQKRPLDRDRILNAKAAAIIAASENTLGVMRATLDIDDIVGLEAVKRFAMLVAKSCAPRTRPLLARSCSSAHRARRKAPFHHCSPRGAASTALSSKTSRICASSAKSVGSFRLR